MGFDRAMLMVTDVEGKPAGGYDLDFRADRKTRRTTRVGAAWHTLVMDRDLLTDRLLPHSHLGLIGADWRRAGQAR
jgi:hypothetical protein